VARAITRHDPVPVKPRRRREGRGRTFRRATAITRRAAWLPEEAHAAAVFLADTLDWLNLWHDDAGETPGEGLPAPAVNDLSPRL